MQAIHPAGICLLGLLATFPFESRQPRSAQPIVRQVDHILFVTPVAQTLVTTLAETFALPVVWPQAGATERTTGISLGNANLEVIPANPSITNAGGRITALALQPADFSSVETELRARDIAHWPPARGPSETAPRWTTVGLRGFGVGMFFIHYDFDMTDRRSRFASELQRRDGGPLGILRIAEVSMLVPSPEEAGTQWTKLFGPPIPGDRSTWAVGDGPRIRLLKRDEGNTSGLVVEVRNLARAAALLRAAAFATERAGHQLRIDVQRLSGLRLHLKEAARP